MSQIDAFLMFDTFIRFLHVVQMKIELKVQLLNIDLLLENDKNPRSIDPEKLKALSESVTAHPELLHLRPLVVKKHDTEKGKYIVLGGNQRLKALKEASIKEVPCLVAPDNFSEDTLDYFVVVDNVSFGKTDEKKLLKNYNIVDMAPLQFYFNEELNISINSNSMSLDFSPPSETLNYKEEGKPEKKSKRVARTCPNCGEDL